MTASPEYRIEHECPQCGSPALLEETDHLVACAYCRVKSLLLEGDFFRYRIPGSAPEGRDLLFIPYWRFKGSLFSAVAGTIRHRIVDMSSRAVSLDDIPLSLGFRTQTRKLRFLSRDTGGRFLKQTVPREEVIATALQRFSSSLPGPLFTRCFIGETMSLIYAPCYAGQDGRLHDALLNRPLASRRDGIRVEDISADLAVEDPGWSIRFLPALCPSCGWDLDGQRDSLAFGCRNCDTLWTCGGDEFRETQFLTLPARGKDSVYFPFYRIRAEVSGIDLASRADLIRLANLPRLPGKECEEKPLYFWSPAFKIRPRELLSFSRQMTLTQPEGASKEQIPRSETQGITLPVSEAAELMKITLASFIKPPSLLRRLNDIDMDPKSVAVVFIPFERRGDEFVQPHISLRIHAAAMGHARHL